jgi:hypothetical protein
VDKLFGNEITSPDVME